MGKNFMSFPSGKAFAFSILDDTDDTREENGRPVYDLLTRLGFRTTKTVWAFDAPLHEKGPYFAGHSLDDMGYLEWVKELSSTGFEIAFHNASMSSSDRATTIKGLDRIERDVGTLIRLHCNHGQNLENLHWGADRYRSFLVNALLLPLRKFGRMQKFEGAEPSSPYYWADVADDRLDYMRAFTYRNLFFPALLDTPFRDRRRQRKMRFFNTSDAPDVWAFNKVVSPRNIDRLRDKGGWAIVSTHLGKGFYRDGSLDEEFVKTMEYLASQNGWFVPVSELLDCLAANSDGGVPFSKIAAMESFHVVDRVLGRIFDRTPY